MSRNDTIQAAPAAHTASGSSAPAPATASGSSAPAPQPSATMRNSSAAGWLRQLCPPRGDAGMATAEYTIATLAACGFAGLLLAILRGEQVRGLLMGIVERALSVG